MHRWAAAPADAEAALSGSASTCFSEADNARLGGVRVFQLAPPPRSAAAAAQWRYWPCTDAATQQDLNASTWAGGRLWQSVWANRRNDARSWNRKPNPIGSPRVFVDGLECRATFTSIRRANAATRTQVRWILGMEQDDYLRPWLNRSGMSRGDVITAEQLRSDPARYCDRTVTHQGVSYRVMTDKVVLAPSRLTEGTNADVRTGIFLDYECQDSRDPIATLRFLTAVADDCHSVGKQLFVLTNPLNAPSQPHTGFDASTARQVLDQVDHLSIWLWSNNRERSIPASYLAQISMLGRLGPADYDKLVLALELGVPGTTLEDARWVYDQLHSPGPGPSKLMFWRHQAEQGGPCDELTNQKIAAACFGDG